MFGTTRILRGIVALAALAGLVGALAGLPAQAAPAGQTGPVTLWGLTTANKILRFASDAPATIQGEVQVTGLGADENLLGIDFRPATGQLFGLGSSSRLYTIDPATGAATVVGTGVLSPTLSGTDFGFDFNPLVDRIRVTSNTAQNLRLNPNNGAVAAVDGTLVYTTTDRNAGAMPNIVGSAYTNNVPGPPGTVLFNIDSNLDVLVTQNPPNNGVLNTVGALGVDTTAQVGFDIIGENMAYAALTVAGQGSGLYMINLSTGAATLVGPIGANQQIRGLTGALSAAPATVTPAATATATSVPATATPMPAMNTPTAMPTAAPPPPTMAPLPTATVMPPGMPVTGSMDNGPWLTVLGLLGLGLVLSGLFLQGRRGTARSRR